MVSKAKQNGRRNRGGWTSPALAYVEQVNNILGQLRDYWPLTLRQGH